MNPSAIAMAIFASLVLYGGLIYYIVLASRGSKRRAGKEK